MSRPVRLSVIAFALIAALVAALASGGGEAAGQAGDRGLERALAAQERASDRLLAKSGVAGTAVGRSASGAAVVRVFTERRGVRGIPASFDGVAVEVDVTGPISAVHHRSGHSGGPGGGGGGGGSDAGLKPTSTWPRPVPIGVSTGSETECSAGTIGVRLTNGSNVYALSNNHVYAAENAAPVGSAVVQAGLFDTGCSFDAANVIGQLSDFEPLVFGGGSNTMDAAVAVSSAANLGTATPPDGYGTPSSTVVAPDLGQRVVKYGRTTAQTSGTVTGVNADINVSYSSGVAHFEDQVVIEGRKPYLKSGDSGSVSVTAAGRHPVGLNFASDASGKTSFANPMAPVLTRFGMTVDGS